VSDTGTGIPKADTSLIFDRFHRVAGSHGRTHEGTGIGLALVQELVKLHHGSIGVESTLGAGTTFSVRLPFGIAHAPCARQSEGPAISTAIRVEAYVSEAERWLPDAVRNAHAPGAARAPPSAAASGPRPRVLVADDNADMRDDLQRLLTPDYDVLAVADGEAALAAARRTRPDIVLTDVMMPHIDGFVLLHKLRTDAALHDVPIIVLSARAGEEAKVEGLNMGADDYLVKPFSARELLARVRTTLELAHSRMQTTRVLREEARVLEMLNKVGIAVAAEVDLERTVQIVTDAATELSRAAFGAFFYNGVDKDGEAYTLYTLSGVSREAFARFPMPRNTAVFGPTFRGEGVVRSADITADPRYGKNEPYFGMPKGHLPVRSHLAVSVLSRSGEVLGGLFFGHPEVGVFDDHAERIVAAIAVQAGIAIDKANLYRAAQDEIERRKRVEAALLNSEETLEARIAERTAELAASNASLLAEAREREIAEGRFKLLVEGVVDYAIYMLDPLGVITNWNTGAQRIKGYVPGEVIGRHYELFFTEDDRNAGLPAVGLGIAADKGKYEAEGWRVRKNGTRFWASVVLNAIRNKHGELIGFAKITRDITERREAMIALQQSQNQLAQAQKMEGMGHLTGGVAHDFNNLLAIIMGNLETMQRTLKGPQPEPQRLVRAADTAMRGAERAAALTQRLLAFSRQQPLDPKAVDVSRLIAGMSDMLRRSLGEQVAVETILGGDLWRVHVDPNQLEVAVVNLAVNARDAMRGGGHLTIETANAYLDERYAAAQADVMPGQYVLIGINDTGCGMTPEILSRVFEPFFTTKDVGHGTGLGLSQVYGFVKQSGGHVKINTQVGEGTSVKIYLPRIHSADDHDESAAQSAAHPQRDATETILLVEDNEDVRAHADEILRELGYRTLIAGTADAALQLLDAHPEIGLLFTDVGLPGGMNGRQLADEALRRRAALKVLFMSGYARDAIVHGGRLDPGVQLITKPFGFAALASKIRSVLDAR
ncbi:MAG: response regulator, partial [Casimicrobiaceae bacterium]